MIIALTGEKLAGKGTAAEYIHTHYNGQLFRFSEVLSDILQRLHQDNSRQNLVKLGQAVRQLYGDDILAQVIYQDILNNSTELKVIDGMRYSAEYTILSKLPNFKLIYITAPVEVRYERTKQRSEKSDEANMSFTEFKQREHDSTEQGIEQLAKLADYVIDNISIIDDLYKRLEQLPVFTVKA
jgi:dephospho-CoA kinase